MTSAATRAINCPSCGAGQTVFGGGRVQTYVCTYCGSALDALDDFKSVAKYGERDRPAEAVPLGTEGVIDGVPFTVIGIARWTDTYGYQTWNWVDHQVYSPTHGYAWITLESSGHATFTRKSRHQPNSWLTSATVEASESRPVRWYNGTRYRYYETSTAEIDYLEGSFNWTPQFGARRTTITLVALGSMLGLSRDPVSSEREVELTRLLTQEEAASFGMAPRAKGHPLHTPPPWKHMGFVLATCGLLAAATVVLMGVVGEAGKRELTATGTQDIASLPHSVTFDVPDDARLLQVNLHSNVHNGWATFEAELEDASGEVVAVGESDVSYYTGRDSDGAWTEGSQFTSVSFPTPGPGSYSMNFALSGYGSGENAGTLTSSFFSANVVSQRASWQPLAVPLAFFVAIFGLTVFAEILRLRALLRGSDWTED